MPVITLTTDYGTRDSYIGELKGVILSLASSVQMVDITHDIEPHNVLHGAFILRRIWPWYPRGTIHVAVVDPGVGSDRRIIIGQYAGQYLVAPDNGLVTLVHRETPAEAMYVVENRRYFMPQLSSTFHGRDIMAPVAAHLANGVSPKECGRATDHLEILPVAHRAESTADGLAGAVLYVDRFGTLVTNIDQEQVAGLGGSRRAAEVLVDGESIGPIRSAFCDVPEGSPVALIGSGGTLEVAINRGSAAERFGGNAVVRVQVR
jgi:S-adenosylmethionine hydrolase